MIFRIPAPLATSLLENRPQTDTLHPGGDDQDEYEERKVDVETLSHIYRQNIWCRIKPSF